jgi:hypothetical protein
MWKDIGLVGLRVGEVAGEGEAELARVIVEVGGVEGKSGSFSDGGVAARNRNSRIPQAARTSVIPMSSTKTRATSILCVLFGPTCACSFRSNSLALNSYLPLSAQRRHDYQGGV